MVITVIKFLSTITYNFFLKTKMILVVPLAGELNTYKFQKARKLINRDGFLHFIKTVLYDFCIYDLWENNLISTQIADCDISLDLRIITAFNEFDDLLERYDLDFSWYEMDFQQIKERLTRGGCMVLALYSNKIAHISWIGLNKNLEGCFYHYPLNYNFEAGIGGTMTAPDFRRKNIYKYVYSQMFKFLRNNGVSRVVFEIDPKNEFIGSTQTKLGSKKFGRIYILKIAVFKFIWFDSKSSN